MISIHLKERLLSDAPLRKKEGKQILSAIITLWKALASQLPSEMAASFDIKGSSLPAPVVNQSWNDDETLDITLHPMWAALVRFILLVNPELQLNRFEDLTDMTNFDANVFIAVLCEHAKLVARDLAPNG